MARDAVVPSLDVETSEAYAFLSARLVRDRRAPVVHLDGNWGMATVFVLEFVKDGRDVHVPDRECWMYARRACPDTPKPLHVYIGTRQLPVPQERCLEPIFTGKDITVFTSLVDVRKDERCETLPTGR